MYLIKYDKDIPLINLVQENILYEEQDFVVKFELQSPTNNIGVKVEDLIIGLEQYFKELLKLAIISNEYVNDAQILADTISRLNTCYKMYKSTTKEQKT